MRYKLLFIISFILYTIYIYPKGYRLEGLVNLSNCNSDIILDSIEYNKFDSILNKDFPLEFFNYAPIKSKCSFLIAINNWDFNIHNEKGINPFVDKENFKRIRKLSYIMQNLGIHKMDTIRMTFMLETDKVGIGDIENRIKILYSDSNSMVSLHRFSKEYFNDMFNDSNYKGLITLPKKIRRKFGTISNWNNFPILIKENSRKRFEYCSYCSIDCALKIKNQIDYYWHEKTQKVDSLMSFETHNIFAIKKFEIEPFEIKLSKNAYLRDTCVLKNTPFYRSWGCIVSDGCGTNSGFDKFGSIIGTIIKGSTVIVLYEKKEDNITWQYIISSNLRESNGNNKAFILGWIQKEY